MAPFGSDYLGAGRILGLGIIITFSYFLYFAKNALLKIAALLVLIVFFSLLLITGGRGPLLATILAMLVPLLLSIRISKTRVFFIKRRVVLIAGVLIVIFGIIGYSLVSGELTTTLRRLLLLFDAERMVYSDQAVRLKYYIDSIKLGITSPLFGHGIGSWPVLTGKGDVRGYSHNLFLEIFSELGLLGLVLFLSLITQAKLILGSWHIVRNEPILTIIVMIFVNTFTTAMLSGDLNSHRLLFAVLGIMTVSNVFKENKENE